MKGIFWLSLLIPVSLLQAITIVSQRDALRQVNGALTQQTEVTVSCSGADFDWNVDYVYQITSDNGVVQPLHINCNRPVRRYFISYYGVIPDEAGDVASRVCTARTPGSVLTAASLVNQTDTAQVGGTTVRVNTGFTLLEEVAGNANNLDNALRVQTPNSTEVVTYPADMTIAALCVGVMATQGFAAYNSYAQCATGPTTDQFNQLDTRIDAAEEAFRKWHEAYQRQRSAVNQTLLAAQNFYQKTEYWMDTTNQRVAEANRTNQLLKQAIAANNRALAKDINAVSASIGDAATMIGAASSRLSQIVNATSSRFQQLFADIGRSYADIARNTHRLAQNMETDKQLALGHVREIQQAIIDQSTNAQKFFLGEGELRAHNRVLQERLDYYRTTPSAGGRLKYPFTNMPGRGPVANPLSLDPSLASILYSNDVFRYQSLFAGVPYGVETRLQFVCDTPTMLTLGPVAPTWRQLYESIGPSGCDPSWQDTANQCKCAVLVTEQRCRLPLGPSGSQLSQWLSSFTNSSFENAGCLSPVAVFNQEQLTDVASVASLFANITQRGLYAVSEYQYRSVIADFTATISFDASLADSEEFLSSMYRSADTIVRNLPYVYFNTLVLSYQKVYDHLDVYDELVFGILPGHMSQSHSLFERIGGEDFTRCTTLRIALYSKYFLTVGVLRDAGVTTNIYVAVGSDSPVLISDPEYIAGNQGVLPREESGLVFDPLDFDRVAYDIPEGDLTLSAFSNAGKVTYPVSVSEEAFDVDVWQYVNGQTFDHNMAGNSASACRVVLDSDPQSPTYRRCISNPQVSGGTHCLLRESYEVFATGSIGSSAGGGYLVLADREGAYTFTTTIPAGVISMETGSACPEVQSLADTSLNTVLRLTNPLAAENRLKITEDGPCGTYENMGVSLPASETVSYTPRFCALASPEQPTRVRIFYRPDLSNTTSYVECPASANVTLNARNANAFAGGVALNFTSTITTIAASVTLDAVAQIKGRLLNLTADLLQQDTLSYSQSFDFRVTQNTSIGAQGIISGLAQIAGNAANASEINLANAARLSRLTRAFSEEIARVRGSTAALVAAAVSQAEAMTEAANIYQLRFSDLQVTTKLLKESMDAYVDATAALGHSIVENVGAMLESDAPNWAPPPNDGSDSGSCSIFESCAWKALANFIDGAGELTGEALLLAADGLLNLAAAGVNGVASLLTGGPLSGFLGGVILIAVLVGLVCCVIQCMPAIVASCKLGVSCLKVPTTTLHVTEASPSAKHLLARCSQFERGLAKRAL